jgi:hypothetical protein
MRANANFPHSAMPHSHAGSRLAHCPAKSTMRKKTSAMREMNPDICRRRQETILQHFLKKAQKGSPKTYHLCTISKNLHFV